VANPPFVRLPMERCAVCGAEEFIPYICRYCGSVHCVYHRLPENHECPNIDQARAPRPIIRVDRPRAAGTIRLLKTHRLAKIPVRELAALLTALLVLGISFSLRFFESVTLIQSLEIFLLMLIVVGTGFLGHELAHKVAAERYGCLAEFKLWTYGAVMALLFAFVSSGRFIFAAPGAVYIASRAGYFGEGIDRKSNGLVSLAGPIVNVIVATIFGVTLLVATTLGVHDLTIPAACLNCQQFRFLQSGVALNIWLGAFNMLPIFILDGQKVMSWDKRIWAAVSVPLWVATLAILFFQLI